MTENKTPSMDELVKVKDYLKDVIVDLKYSTKDNFTKNIIYDYKDAYLRYGTVKRLENVQNELKEMGLNLKIWDAFRTVKSQFVMWEVYPVDDYVADPYHGFSNHSRGNAIDLTLVDSLGNELEMPTAFDDFEAMEKYDYSALENEKKTKNAYLLKDVMVKWGFRPSTSEWWHFTDVDKYEVEENFSGK